MDYLIEEVAKLGSEYFLVILGQYEAETEELISMASSKISGRYIIANVSYEEVKDYYVAADYFVLASLNEGFGRVLIEALSYGLPCIVHNYINARQVLGGNATYIDMKEKCSLARYFTDENMIPNKELLIQTAYELYSWDVLKTGYLEMISKLIIGV